MQEYFSRGFWPRRSIFRMAAGGFILNFRIAAAADFWNRKPPSEWTEQEISQLISHSPWAKEVNADFATDAEYTVNGREGPSIGRGGQVGPPGSGGTSGQYEIGRAREGPSGAKRRQPVVVRWASAQPILDAVGVPLAAEWKDRHVLSVSGLPLGVMERRRGQDTPSVDPRENTPAARQRRMAEELQAASTLEARGKEPAQPGLVRPSRMPGEYLFGFSRELLPLSRGDREVIFTVHTARLTLKARFEPKEMLYHGKLAV